MKNLKYVLLLAAATTLLAFQTNQGYSSKQIEQFVREVFGVHADELVLKSTSGRKTIIENFLQRVAIVDGAAYGEKKFDHLSTIGIQHKYNPHLIRDTAFDPSAFNPLKYKFPMHSRQKLIYRVDGTNWLIIIKPVHKT